MSNIVSKDFTSGDGNNLISINQLGTGTNRAGIFLISAKAQSSGGITLDSVTYDGNVGEVFYEQIVPYGNFAICYFNESVMPVGAGAFNIQATYSGSAEDTAFYFIEYDDAAQVSTNFILTISEEAASTAADTLYPFTITHNGAAGEIAIPFIATMDSGFFDPRITLESANMANKNFQDQTYAHLYSYDDLVVDTASEVYTGTFDHGRAGRTPDGLFVGALTVPSGAVDSAAPTFTVAPAVTAIGANGATATATINELGDIFYVVVLDGAAAPTPAEVLAGTASGGGASLASGSVAANTVLSSAFVGLNTSTAYDVYFIAQDDEGTPNVQAAVTKVDFTTSTVIPVITNSVGHVAGGTTTVTTSAAVDLTSGTVTATRNGTALTGIAVNSAIEFEFTEPTDGLELGTSSDIIVSVDAAASAPWSATFLPALGAFVTLTVDFAGLHPDSLLNVAAYSALLTGDQIDYQPTLTPSGNACSMDSEGLLTITGGNGLPDQTFDYAIIQASDTYARGAPAVETILEAPPIPIQVPVIVEVGGNTLSQAVDGAAYSDPAWTATDDIGTVAIVWSGDTVDISTVGVYVRTATATNIVGNDIANYTVTITAIPATVFPTIVTVGGTILNQTVGGNSYSDPAWTASDDVGSVGIVWSGDTVDVNTVGVYVRTATATNIIGDDTEIYTITIAAVVPTVTPTIITVGGSSLTQTEGGAAYSDPAWTASDDTGPLAIVWTGDIVDINVPAVYLRTATATNSLGSDVKVYTVTIEATIQPALSVPFAVGVSPVAVAGSVVTNTANGVLYFLASTNPTETVLDIKLGGSQVITQAGSTEVLSTGLTPLTDYYMHFVQTNTSDVDSNVAVSALITTEAQDDLVIVSTTQVRLNTIFTITVGGAYDLTEASEITATIAGIQMSGVSNITATTVDFLVPAVGLSLINPSPIVLTIVT